MGSEEAWRETRAALKMAVDSQQPGEALRCARELLTFDKPTDCLLCATAFEKIKEALLAQGHRLLKTTIVRSVTVEPILPCLNVEAVLAGYLLQVVIGGYGSYISDLLDPPGAAASRHPDLVLLLLDTEEIAGGLSTACAAARPGQVATEMDAALERMAQLLHTYRSQSSARLVLQGCLVPNSTAQGPVADAHQGYSLPNSVRELNRRLAELCSSIADCAFFDVDQVAAEHGRIQWRDTRLFLASRLPVAPGSFCSFAHALMRTVSSLFRPPRKVLCTDLDETLWGGTLGEDGVHAIATGADFPGNGYLSYQRHLKELASRGILLAIVSKNSEAEVEQAFAARAADLAIGLDDFVARRIGWSDKVDALRELSQELSLGLDSFVFVDDHPVECEAVRQSLPEVAVVQAPTGQPWQTVSLLMEGWFFDSAVLSEEDLSRSGHYKAQAHRTALAKSTVSRADFLHSLDITCSFLDLQESHVPRAVQLSAKTNQFNLTSRRYSAHELSACIADHHSRVLLLRVGDRFGDSGVVGMALTRQQGEICRIESLLLSCRVIGRGIETAMLARVAEYASALHTKWLIGEYIPTGKNSACKDFYATHGFAQHAAAHEEAGSIVYRLDLQKQRPQTPAWLTVAGGTGT